MGAVKMRMTYNNRLQPSLTLNPLNSLIIKQRDTIPENIALWRFDKNSTLSNSQFRHRRDERDILIRRTLSPFVFMLVFQFPQRRERLSRRRDELARVIADVTCLEGAAIRRWELSSASIADEP